MENAKKRQQVPAFGSWNFWDDVPITECFESAMEAGLIHSHLFGGDGEEPSKVVSPQQQKHRGKGKKADQGGRGRVKQYEWRKTKPVDEDLYKIPPELLCKIPRKKKLLWNLWAGCLGLNCIA
ncbi:putative nuclear receptor subfamily 4 group A member 3-like [Cocos nucifera]|uniref:Putative nuclear receptor subfamily 4 group A member 3-like n=1 Tax=Cocos nucifera TaxID=13894 RepID=A0A8K0N9L5_COCNU|nr:putative nuclear receptor subfamily 4 group A member 3-like [Cocos nucifera]